MRRAWIDNDKIRLKFGGSTFQADLELVKSIAGRFFDVKKKEWTVPDTKDNRETLFLAKFDIDADIAIDFVEEIDETWKSIEVDFPQLEDRYDLYPFQKDTLRYLSAHNNRAVIGLPPGAGKTLVSEAFIEMTPNSLPALIICPSPVKVNFKNDYKKFFGKTNIEILEGSDSLAKYKKKQIYVINYELLSRAVDTKTVTYKDRSGRVQRRKHKVLNKNIERFIATGFNTVIVDEVHRIKNEESNAFFAFKHIIENTENVIGMSGTPILSRPSEIWSYWNQIKPKVWPTKQLFLNRYCEPKQIFIGRGRKITTYNGATNMYELNRKLRNNGMIVMDKETILPDLPPRPIRTVVPIEMDDYDEYLELRDLIIEQIYENPSLILTKFEKLKQAAVKYKFKHMIEYIDGMLEVHEKLVVFADHQKIVEKLHKHYKDSAMFNGTLTAKQKEVQKQRFMDDPKCRVIIGNTQSMGTGVDGLQKSGATAIAFVEFPWNPSDLEQAEGRLWRDGFSSEKGISVHYLVGAGTIEEEIIERLDQKQTVVDGVIRGEAVNSETLLTVLRDKYYAIAKKLKKD